MYLIRTNIFNRLQRQKGRERKVNKGTCPLVTSVPVSCEVREGGGEVVAVFVFREDTEDFFLFSSWREWD